MMKENDITTSTKNYCNISKIMIIANFFYNIYNLFYNFRFTYNIAILLYLFLSSLILRYFYSIAKCTIQGLIRVSYTVQYSNR
uniref:Uncharacterized protein n=1 Tax=Cannabis sativa TaxID=3483 RepID=A0A803R9J7_CANSA